MNVPAILEIVLICIVVSAVTMLITASDLMGHRSSWVILFILSITLFAGGLAGNIKLELNGIPGYTPLLDKSTLNMLRVYQGMFFAGLGGCLLYFTRSVKDGAVVLFFILIPIGTIITIIGLLHLW